jgi:hypothetical protein
MAKNHILVRNINHLTDARYFAAMGIDWMSMLLTEDQKSFSKWHTMREWISGVKLAAELKSDDESLIAKTIIDVKPDGIVTNTLEFIHLTGGLQLFLLMDSFPSTMDPVYSQIIPYDPIMLEGEINQLQSPDTLYLEAEWTPELIKEVKSKNYNGGFCFQAGNEIEVGIKDYSEMDVMLDLILN